MPADEWTTWSYDEYYAECVKTAKSLIASGVEAHDAVNIYGFNAPEWLMGEVSAILTGAMAAGIYPTDTVDQVTFKSKHSGAAVAFVGDEAKFLRMKEAVENLPKMKAIVAWDCDHMCNQDITCKDGRVVKVYSWKAFLEVGADVPDSVLDERIAAQSPGHCCAIIYTSGTTGDPKGVMISHDNIIFDAGVSRGTSLRTSFALEERQWVRVCGWCGGRGHTFLVLQSVRIIEAKDEKGSAGDYLLLIEAPGLKPRNMAALQCMHPQVVMALVPHIGQDPSDPERILSYLPLSHVAGMMVDIIMPLYSTAYLPATMNVSFARVYDLKAGSLKDRLQSVKPTLFLGVPRVWEKIAEKMKAIGASITGVKKKISTWAKVKITKNSGRARPFLNYEIVLCLAVDIGMPR